MSRFAAKDGVNEPKIRKNDTAITKSNFFITHVGEGFFDLSVSVYYLKTNCMSNLVYKGEESIILIIVKKT